MMMLPLKLWNPISTLNNFTERKFVKYLEYTVIPLVHNLTYDAFTDVVNVFPIQVDELAKMTVPEIVRHHGYPCEIHKVVTEDGYILTMHRIPHGRGSFGNGTVGKEPKNQEPKNQESMNREPKNRDPKNQEPMNQESRNPEFKNQQSINKEPMNQEHRNQKHINQKHTNQKPTNQKPTNQTPTNQTPTNQTSTHQKPTSQIPTNQKPTNQKPANQNPFAKEHASNEHFTKEPFFSEPLESPKFKRRYPIFLLHGVNSSSAPWVLRGPDHALAYQLADYGFDVWMGNFRGNSYSRNHIKLDPTLGEFWDFSAHELGIYDLPAMIDYTLRWTRHSKLFFLGHSLGAAICFIMCSQKPYYNQKIIAHISISPVTYVKNCRSPITSLLLKLGPNFLQYYARLIGWNECLRQSSAVLKFKSLLFKQNSLFAGLHKFIMFHVGGLNPSQYDDRFQSTLIGHNPEACSLRTFLHFAQIYNSDRFAHYDYKSDNPKYYGSKEPPLYKLADVTTPVHILYGNNDYLSSEVDLQKLLYELGNPKKAIKVDDPFWTHYDFLFGNDAPRLVYDYVCRIAADYVYKMELN